MKIKSNINNFFSKDLLIELDNVCRDVTISDNNRKIDLMVDILESYGYGREVRVGPGTNRYAILLNDGYDSYIFKIALDRYGKIDNWAEFNLSKELQPFVTKTYECNGLICVAEYVTVLSKEDFDSNKEKIARKLSTLSEDWLFGDMGITLKNYMNWGTRPNGDIVCLDYAYTYRVTGTEMVCGNVKSNGEVCKGMLEYDENFIDLRCPHCGKKYNFLDIRSRLRGNYNKETEESAKRTSYLMPHDVSEMEVVDKFKDSEEDYTMRNYEERFEITEEQIEEMYVESMDDFARAMQDPNIINSPSTRPETVFNDDDDDYYEEPKTLKEAIWRECERREHDSQYTLRNEFEEVDDYDPEDDFGHYALTDEMLFKTEDSYMNYIDEDDIPDPATLDDIKVEPTIKISGNDHVGIVDVSDFPEEEQSLILGKLLMAWDKANPIDEEVEGSRDTEVASRDSEELEGDSVEGSTDTLDIDDDEDFEEDPDIVEYYEDNDEEIIIDEGSRDTEVASRDSEELEGDSVEGSNIKENMLLEDFNEYDLTDNNDGDFEEDPDIVEYDCPNIEKEDDAEEVEEPIIKVEENTHVEKPVEKTSTVTLKVLDENNDEITHQQLRDELNTGIDEYSEDEYYDKYDDNDEYDKWLDQANLESRMTKGGKHGRFN